MVQECFGESHPRRQQRAAQTDTKLWLRTKEGEINERKTYFVEKVTKVCRAWFLSHVDVPNFVVAMCARMGRNLYPSKSGFFRPSFDGWPDFQKKVWLYFLATLVWLVVRGRWRSTASSHNQVALNRVNCAHARTGVWGCGTISERKCDIHHA